MPEGNPDRATADRGLELCVYHAAEVQVACEALAAEAYQIVDEETGVGTSNGEATT